MRKLFDPSEPAPPQLGKILAVCYPIFQKVSEAFKANGVHDALCARFDGMRDAFLRYLTRAYMTQSSADVCGIVCAAKHMLNNLPKSRDTYEFAYTNPRSAPSDLGFAAMDEMYLFFNVAGIRPAPVAVLPSEFRDLPEHLQAVILKKVDGPVDVDRALIFAQRFAGYTLLSLPYDFEYNSYRFMTKRVAAYFKADELDEHMGNVDDWWVMYRFFAEWNLLSRVFVADRDTPCAPMAGEMRLCRVCVAAQGRVFVSFHNAFCKKPTQEAARTFLHDLLARSAKRNYTCTK